MKIQELLNYLESIAPPVYQESYDNAGLITGSRNAEITGALTCLDATEAVIEEAIKKGCNLVVAHHPIIFRGLKTLTGRNYVERVVIKAIKHDIAIYAIHTNLDNVYYRGVNARIAEKLGLVNTRILAPKQEQRKLFTIAPATESSALQRLLLEAGAQEVIRIENVRRQTSKTAAGNVDTPGVKLEVRFDTASQAGILKALRDSRIQDGLTYEIITLENKSQALGSGMIGRLPEPMEEKQFLVYLKKAMQLTCIRHTALLGRKIDTVALCGGAGGFLLGKALSQKADIFITADYKYHEFFDADQKILIADIGHYESEQFTIELLYEIIKEKFSNFAVHCTEVNTNPINYI